MTDRKILGYLVTEDKPASPLYEPPNGSIVTHAFILCMDCGEVVYHCMGPKYNCVCLKCWEAKHDSN